jgi:hypothetical protein
MSQPSLFDHRFIVEEAANPHALDSRWRVVDTARPPSWWSRSGCVVSVHPTRAEAEAAVGESPGTGR